VESNHHSQGQRGYSPLSSPVLSVRAKGDRPDSNRYREVHDLGCCRYTTVTATKSSRIDKRCLGGDDRTRTGGFSADNRALFPLSYAPEWRGWDSNPRSRAHEAREDIRSSTALRCKGLAGRSRTCDLRCPKPAGWPTPPQPDRENPRRDSNPPLWVEGPASSPIDHGGKQAPAAGIEPAPRDQQSRVFPARLHRNETEAAGFEPADVPHTPTR
jgi:hypothetical protein